MFLTQIY